MIGYTTEVDLKKKEIRTTFGKETRTFCFDDAKGFTCLDAMKIAAEDMHNQILEFLSQLCEHADRWNNVGRGKLRSDKYPKIVEYLNNHGPSKVKHMADKLGLNCGNLCMLLKSGERHMLFKQNQDRTWDLMK